MKQVNLFSIIIPLMLTSCVATVTVTTSEPDTKLSVDGMDKGTNTTQLNLKNENCATIRAEKTGFITQEMRLCYQDFIKTSNKTKYIVMQKDDAYNASVQSDQANLDFTLPVNKKLNESEAWKLISQIVLNYFDLIEMSDKETGYMRTNWAYQKFAQNSIRTRIIVKQSNSNPLTYKVKIVSEASGKPDTSVKDDASFKEWNRLIKKYEDALSEFQSRLVEK